MKALKRVFRGIFFCFTNINRRNCAYKIVALLGLIIRVIFLPMFLPDVFEVIAETMISSWGLPDWAYIILIRIFLLFIDAIGLSNIFYWISFASVGNNYNRNSIPVWGSICYTVYYISYNIIAIVLIRNFEFWAITVTFLSYLALVVIIFFISFKLSEKVSGTREVLPKNFLTGMIVQYSLATILFIVFIIIRNFAF